MEQTACRPRFYVEVMQVRGSLRPLLTVAVISKNCMAAIFITFGILIGDLLIISILLCGNVIFYSWKLHFYIKEEYPSDFEFYRSKFSPFSATKIIYFLDDNDLTLIEITVMIEKRTKFFLLLFSICILSISLFAASGLLLHVFKVNY